MHKKLPSAKKYVHLYLFEKFFYFIWRRMKIFKITFKASKSNWTLLQWLHYPSNYVWDYTYVVSQSNKLILKLFLIANDILLTPFPDDSQYFTILMAFLCSLSPTIIVLDHSGIWILNFFVKKHRNGNKAIFSIKNVNFYVVQEFQMNL